MQICYFALNSKLSRSLDLHSQWVSPQPSYLVVHFSPRQSNAGETNTPDDSAGPKVSIFRLGPWTTERLAPCAVDASQRPSSFFVKLGMNVFRTVAALHAWPVAVLVPLRISKFHLNTSHLRLLRVSSTIGRTSTTGMLLLSHHAE